MLVIFNNQSETETWFAHFQKLYSNLSFSSKHSRNITVAEGQ